jgi:hypothetical protein
MQHPGNNICTCVVAVVVEFGYTHPAELTVLRPIVLYVVASLTEEVCRFCPEHPVLHLAYWFHSFLQSSDYRKSLESRKSYSTSRCVSSELHLSFEGMLSSSLSSVRGFFQLPKVLDALKSLSSKFDFSSRILTVEGKLNCVSSSWLSSSASPVSVMPGFISRDTTPGFDLIAIMR